MGCGATKERTQLIAYQRDFLGACWDSPYGEEEATMYVPSRWMGLSKATMHLHTGNHCYVYGYAKQTAQKGMRSPFQAGAAAPLSLLDPQLPEETGVIPTGHSHMPSRLGSEEALDGMHGRLVPHYHSAHLPPSLSSRTQPGRLSEAASSRGGPRQPERRLSTATGQSFQVAMREAGTWVAHDTHPYLKAYGLAVSSGVTFRVAPSHRRYDRIACVPSALEVALLEHSASQGAPNDSRFVGQVDAQGTRGTSHTPLIPPTVQPRQSITESFGAAAARVGATDEDPLSPANNYTICDVDTPVVQAQAPPVVIGSISVMELQALPPNAEVCLGGWLYISLEDEQTRLRKSLARYEFAQRVAVLSNGQSAATVAAAQCHADGAPRSALEAKDDGEMTEGTWLPHAFILIALPMYECSVFSTAYHLAQHRPRNIAINLKDPISREKYGVGCITRVRYGGVMVIEYRDRVNVADEAWVHNLIALGAQTRARYAHGPRGTSLHTPASRGGPNFVESPDPAGTAAAQNGGGAGAVFPATYSLLGDSNRDGGGSDTENRQRLEAIDIIKRRIRTRLRGLGVYVVRADTRLAARRRRSWRREVGCSTPGGMAGSPSYVSEDGFSDGEDGGASSTSSSADGNSDAEDDPTAAGRRENVFERRRPTRMIRGTFRQIGGMRYLNAVSLMEGCPVSEVVTAVERWILNLLRVPIKARPLSLYLQRYEGLANSLRLGTHSYRNEAYHRMGKTPTSVLLTNASFNATSLSYAASPTGSTQLNNGSFPWAAAADTPRDLHLAPHYSGPLWRGVVPILSPQLLNLLQTYIPMGGEGMDQPRPVSIPPIRGATPTVGPLPPHDNGAVSWSRAAGTVPRPKKGSTEVNLLAIETASVNSGLHTPDVKATPDNVALLHPALTSGMASPDVKLLMKQHSVGVAVSSDDLPHHNFTNAGTIEQLLMNPYPRHGRTSSGSTATLPTPGTPPSNVMQPGSPLAARMGTKVITRPAQKVRRMQPSLSRLPPGKDRLRPTVSESATCKSQWTWANERVRALKSELDEMRFLVSNAQTELEDRIEEFIVIGSLFLPHTHVDQIRMTMLFVKTLRQYPEDVPVKELHTDWLPTLYALLTTDDADLQPGTTAVLQWTGSLHWHLPNDVCDANRAPQNHDNDQLTTRYALQAVRHEPRMRSGLREVSIALIPYQLLASTAHSLQKSGTDSGLSFVFTGGSLGTLAGLLHYYTDFVAAKFRSVVQRLWGPGPPIGEHPNLKDYATSATDLLEREHQVLLQRIAVWGAAQGTKKTQTLAGFNRVHDAFCAVSPPDEWYEPAAQTETDARKDAAAHAAAVGIPFRGAECFALFDAIAYYLSTLEVLQREFSGDFEAEPKPARRKRSLMGPLFASKLRKNDCTLSSTPRPNEISYSMLRSPANSQVLEASSCLHADGNRPKHPIIATFELCVLSNYYYTTMVPIGAQIVDDTEQPQRRWGTNTTRRRTMGGTASYPNASTSQRPTYPVRRSSGGGREASHARTPMRQTQRSKHLPPHTAGAICSSPAATKTKRAVPINEQIAAGGESRKHEGLFSGSAVSGVHTKKLEMPYCGGQESDNDKVHRRWRQHNRQLFTLLNEQLDKWRAQHHSQAGTGRFAKHISITYV